VDGAREEGRTDNFGHPTCAATQLIPYGKFALERGVAGRGAKLALNELGAISFTMRGRGDRTATRCGEAGIPSSMTVGVGDLTRTSAEPSTETWVCVIGNPNVSKAGRSSAFALIPPSTTAR